MMSTAQPTDRLPAWTGLLTLLATLSAGQPLFAAQTNNVTGGDTVNYTINNLSDPPFTFQRGSTYIFQLSGITIHPFWIKFMLDGNFANGASAFTNGVVNNGATSGTLTFTVPANAPNQLFYQCGNHAAMNGTLTIINPPTPPPFSIVGLSVSNSITLRHTGTNTFTYAPEFTTNLVTTNWVTLVVQSNFFANGTNEVICGLPAGTNFFIRVRAQ